MHELQQYTFKVTKNNSSSKVFNTSAYNKTIYKTILLPTV